MHSSIFKKTKLEKTSKSEMMTYITPKIEKIF